MQRIHFERFCNILGRVVYFFFESRGKKDDPFMIWLTELPGCSSELAVFYENMPFTIANMSLAWNKFILIWLDACRSQISHSLINQLELTLATNLMTMILVMMRLVSAMICMTFSRYCFFINFFLLKCFISTASSPCDVWLHYRSLVNSFWSVVEYKHGKLK
jgi:hypothetical protein